MKIEHFVVSSCSMIVAAASLLFYSILTAQINVELMAAFITSTAIAGLFQIVFVPNSMLFVYSSRTEERRKHNVFYAFLFEITGVTLGLLALIIASPFLNDLNVLVLAFLSFALAASTGGIGYLRGERRWVFYALAFVLPSIMRFTLILIDQANDQVANELRYIVLRYFFIPEIIRYLIVVPFIVLPHVRIPRWRSAKCAFRMVFHNWIFDGGSAIVELGDRIILSVILSPTMLVLYFFARKLGAGATVVLEPFYAISFKSFLNAKVGSYTSKDIFKVLGTGYFIGGVMALLIFGFLFVVIHSVPNAERFIPVIVVDFPIMFGVLLLIDSMIAANRWSRYLSLLDSRALILLGWRLVCLGLFIAAVWVWPSDAKAMGLIVGFFFFALAEHLFILVWVRTFQAKKG